MSAALTCNERGMSLETLRALIMVLDATDGMNGRFSECRYTSPGTTISFSLVPSIRAMESDIDIREVHLGAVDC